MEPVPETASPAPGERVDRCLRCGRPTAEGRGLCDECNPADIAGPTPTQVHGTIVAGLGIAFLVVALAARFLVGGGVPFAIAVQGQAALADGSLDVVFAITNGGDREAHPTCTVHRSSTDAGYVFIGPTIAAGATVEVRRSIPPMPGAGGPGGGTAPLVEATCR